MVRVDSSIRLPFSCALDSNDPKFGSYSGGKFPYMLRLAEFLVYYHYYQLIRTNIYNFSRKPMLARLSYLAHLSRTSTQD